MMMDFSNLCQTDGQQLLTSFLPGVVPTSELQREKLLSYFSFVFYYVLICNTLEARRGVLSVYHECGDHT